MSSLSTEPVERWLEFYRQYATDGIIQLARAYPDDRRSLYVNWGELHKYHEPLAEAVLSSPAEMQHYAERALGRFDTGADVSLTDAHVRFTDLPDRVTLTPQECGAEHFGNLVTVVGTVTSAGTPEARPHRVAFECQSCRSVSHVPVDQTRTVQMTNPPETCPECDASDSTFEPRPEEDEHIDYQEAIIEGPAHGGDEEAETLLATATDDLTRQFRTGQHVAITGTLHHDPAAEDNHGSLSDRYLSVSSIEERRATQYVDQPRTPVDGDAVSVPEAKAAVAEAAGCDPVGEMPGDAVLDVLEGSLAPAVPGLDTLRRAILLQLAGGVPKVLPDDSRIRGDIHVLAMAPPGIQATRLLDAAARTAPYAVETDASESTAVGLTASASRHGSGFRIEGGPVTNADDGLLTIRNLDAAGGDLQRTLGTVLEDQEFTVTKGDAKQKLRARTSVLASAQPKYGEWDEYESISQQIGLKPALISSFDLIFTFRDEADVDADRKQARKILAANQAAEPEAGGDAEQGERAVDQSVVPHVAPDTLRQYLAHVKETYNPTMSEEAKEHIEKFYVGLRSQGAEEDAPTPVTREKLEALVRLAEAAARLRCSETVSEVDARLVTELVSDSLADIGMDPETNEFDADMIEAGHSKNQRDRIKGLKAIIEELEVEHDKGAPLDEVLEMAVENGTSRDKAEHEIEKLKQRGEVYEQFQGYLRTT